MRQTYINFRLLMSMPIIVCNSSVLPQNMFIGLGHNLGIGADQHQFTSESLSNALQQLIARASDGWGVDSSYYIAAQQCSIFPQGCSLIRNGPLSARQTFWSAPSQKLSKSSSVAATDLLPLRACLSSKRCIYYWRYFMYCVPLCARRTCSSFPWEA